MERTNEFLRMVENPSIYSDAELLELLSDKDCIELYRAICLSASAFEMVDAKKRTSEGLKEKEWHHFETRMRKDCHRSLPKMRIAAILICMLVFAGIIYAAFLIHIGKWSGIDTQSVVQSEQTVNETRKDEIMSIDTVVIFKNVELGDIVNRLESHYSVKAVFRKEKVRRLRFYTKWNPSEPLETIVESLNSFEKIDITLEDRTLIIQ